jgi:prevent-host-death family protein
MTIETILYTDAMPADMNAEEIGIAEARSNLTELVTHVRMLKQVKFLTNRSRRMAALVPIEYYNRAERAFRLVAERPDLAKRLDPAKDD